MPLALLKPAEFGFQAIEYGLSVDRSLVAYRVEALGNQPMNVFGTKVRPTLQFAHQQQGPVHDFRGLAIAAAPHEIVNQALERWIESNVHVRVTATSLAYSMAGVGRQ
jgi:hypothetical protein